MKFAHMADCHIGGWRDPKLSEISVKAFLRAIDICIEEKVDFVLIAGDLFNTSLPGVERLRIVTEKLKELHDSGIPCYIIAGSHDFSPSGKSMLDVLESAGLFVNVAKGSIVDAKLDLQFTTDPKTQVKLTGIIGKKGGLEKKYYTQLVKENLEAEPGEKIFMFHSSITEMKPAHLKEMDSDPVSILPRGFKYYAGGHVHIVEKYADENYPAVVYPGPLFPNNFKELELLHHGGFYLVEDWQLRYVPLKIHPTHHITLEVKDKTPQEVTALLEEEIKEKDFENTIVTIRVLGKMVSGKPSDVDFKKIFRLCYEKGAYFVMKNTHKLESKEFEEISIHTGSMQDIEHQLIKEHLSQQDTFDMNTIQRLMKAFSLEKNEGERIVDFEARLIAEAEAVATKEKIVVRDEKLD